MLGDVNDAVSKQLEYTDKKARNGSPYALLKDKTKLALSTLLNVLIGIILADDQVLIMTNNYIKHIEGTHIQPGYMDKKFKFQLPNKKMIAQLFCCVY